MGISWPFGVFCFGLSFLSAMTEMLPDAHPLKGVRLKLDRAYEHLMALQHEIGEFFKLQPHRFTHQRRANGTEYVIRGNVVQEPPESLPLIIGDCLQNMRSALDHLAWELGVSQVGGDPPSYTSFPISRTYDAFHERDNGGRLTSRSGLKKIDTIHPDAQTYIEGLQPYQRGEFEADTDPLWILNELARIDRHRNLSVIGSTTRHTSYAVGKRDSTGAFVADSGSVLSAELNFGTFEDGADILRITLRKPDPSMEVQFDGTTHITLRNAGAATGINVVDLLSSVHRHVKYTVLPEFGEFFV